MPLAETLRADCPLPGPAPPPGLPPSSRPGIAVLPESGGEGLEAQQNGLEAGEGDGSVPRARDGTQARAGGDAQLEGVAAAHPVFLGQPQVAQRWITRGPAVGFKV